MNIYATHFLIYFLKFCKITLYSLKGKTKILLVPLKGRTLKNKQYYNWGTR